MNIGNTSKGADPIAAAFVDDLSSKLRAADALTHHLREANRQLKNELAEYSHTISAQRAKLQDNAKLMDELDAEIDRLRAHHVSGDRLLDAQREIDMMMQDLEADGETIRGLEAQIDVLEKLVDRKNVAIDALIDVLASREVR